MEIQEKIVNRVAQSGLISLDLADLKDQHESVLYDIKENLFHGLILREKDFREFIKEHDWSAYAGKNVAITCTAEAIVPTWAYMLLASRLAPYANYICFGTLEAMDVELYNRAIDALRIEDFEGKRIVVKGCGDVYVPTSAFVRLTDKLSRYARSIMYGEPCSTVPVFKRKE